MSYFEFRTDSEPPEAPCGTHEEPVRVFHVSRAEYSDRLLRQTLERGLKAQARVIVAKLDPGVV
jgi:hypothetical protein